MVDGDDCDDDDDDGGDDGGGGSICLSWSIFRVVLIILTVEVRNLFVFQKCL